MYYLLNQKGVILMKLLFSINTINLDLHSNFHVMIRTHITPQNANISIVVPQNYVGKKVEVLLYTIDELEEEIPNKANTMSVYKGLLSAEEAKELQQQVAQSREEWNNNI